MDEAPKRIPIERPKSRNCLKCGGAFLSEWIGARVCPRCKSGSAWRSTYIKTHGTSVRRK